MIVIGYTSKVIDGKVLISDSSGQRCHSSSIEDLLLFLVAPQDDPYHIRLVWELADFTAPIFRLLSDNALDSLAKTHKTWLGRLNIFYIPGKVLSMAYGRWKANYYELAQFYTDIPEPGDMSEIADLGVDLLRELRKVGMYIKPGDRLSSPAAVLEDKLLNELDLPKDTDVPEEFEGCNAYAWACCGKLWISAIKLGHWHTGEIFDFDLTGAFAYEASQLMDFRKAKFVYSKQPVLGADWGFMRGIVTIDCSVSPIMNLMEDGSFGNPIGTWETILTLDEARFISRYKIGRFKMIDGYFMFENSKAKPLEPIIQKLYQLRRQTPTLDLFLKRATLGCFYGKFIEVHVDGPGKHFAPILAATISSRTRLKVGAFILDNNLINDVAHVSVDGLLATKKVELPPAQGLGKWRISEPSGVIVASAGQVFKKTPERSTKPKGISYDDLVAMVAEHPRCQRYEIKIPRRVTLGEAARGDYDRLGTIKNFHSSIDFILQQHGDRHFPKQPKTGENLLNRVYESEAICLKGKEV